MHEISDSAVHRALCDKAAQRPVTSTLYGREKAR
jgi:hypothetical protein